MTVIFSLLIIVCGIISALCFIGGNIGAGFLNIAIVVLSIIALLGRIAYEKGLFSSINSQKNNTPQPTNNSVPHPVSDPTDEIKKYKELYDSGTITEEEFNAKKKQILGL